MFYKNTNTNLCSAIMFYRMKAPLSYTPIRICSFFNGLDVGSCFCHEFINNNIKASTTTKKKTIGIFQHSCLLDTWHISCQINAYTLFSVTISLMVTTYCNARFIYCSKRPNGNHFKAPERTAVWSGPLGTDRWPGKQNISQGKRTSVLTCQGAWNFCEFSIMYVVQCLICWTSVEKLWVQIC